MTKKLTDSNSSKMKHQTKVLASNDVNKGVDVSALGQPQSSPETKPAVKPRGSKSRNFVEMVFRLPSNQALVVKSAIEMARAGRPIRSDAAALKLICAGYVGRHTRAAASQSLDEFISAVGPIPILERIAQLNPDVDITVAPH